MIDRRSCAVLGKLVPGKLVPGKLVPAKLAAAVAMAIALAAPAPQAAADGVTGQVVGPDAKPVPGADVVLFSSWQPHADRVYESRSDEAGRFKIDVGGDHRMPVERRYIPQAWQTVADAFGLSGQEFHKQVATEVWRLWTIDKEDL